jgi:hypothetical protein
MIWSMSPANAVSSMLKSSMMISAARQAERWHAPDRLVAWLCAGKVGAVLCFDASRLARNGRDWHHLLELCGLVEARVIDLDGVYNPCRLNDRLLLGMKAASASSSSACCAREYWTPPGPRPAGANCGYRFRSATFGTVKRGLVSIPIYVSRR